MSGKMSNRDITQNNRWILFFTSSYFLVVALMITLLLGGLGIALLLGGRFGHRGMYVVVVFIAALFMLTILILRQNALAVGVAILASIYVDWFLGFYITSQVIALLLLIIFFLARSPQYPWAEPRVLWLWFLYLLLTIIPSIQGASNPEDAFYYYPNIVLGALIMFWLGTVASRSINAMRNLFKVLGGIATLIAIHAIIQAVTGKLLFATSSVNNFLASKSFYQLEGANFQVSRAASFFVQPDAGSAFLAAMFLIPLGLLIESSSLRERGLYLAEVILILIALLFTYGVGAWVAAVVGIVVFVIFVGSMLSRIQIIFCMAALVEVLIMSFSSQISLLFQHAMVPDELSLRQGLWETALRVIKAHPLTGIGLGRATYLLLSNPYRVPAEYVAENNPHNSYLELAAMAGLPVLIIFLALLGVALWHALHNWMQADEARRSLFAAGIASIAVLCFNSLTFGVWTLPPLASLGWLMLGIISSPLLLQKANQSIAKER